MAAPQPARETDRRPAATISRAALLTELSAAYPEVSAPGVAQILDRAYLAAKLGTGTVDQRIVAVLARDRLEVLRARTAALLRPGSCGDADGPDPIGSTGEQPGSPREGGSGD